MKLDPKLQEKLGELFAVSAEDLAREEYSSELPGARLVKIDQIQTAEQPRQYFDPAVLKDLANSIRELHMAGKGIAGTGILQPLLVRRASVTGQESVTQYIVTAGERRLRAANMVGLQQLPVIIDDSTSDEAWEHAIVENLLRADLSPLEEAHALHKLMQIRGYSVREAAKQLGKDKGYLENRLFLLKAPQDVQELVSARADTIRHAREISKIEETRVRRKLIERTLKGASFVEIQQSARAFLDIAKRRGDKTSADLTVIEPANGTLSNTFPVSKKVSAHTDTSERIEDSTLVGFSNFQNTSAMSQVTQSMAWKNMTSSIQSLQEVILQLKENNEQAPLILQLQHHVDEIQKMIEHMQNG
jgi:ParB family chromosome partitioning protein